tara:strand:+ start:905 stop:1108 length:204 start_codon:yes stop_codon:yes gene_type:complete
MIKEMTPEDKAAMIKGFTEIINNNEVIDYEISSIMKEVDITGPRDKVDKFMAGVRTMDIRLVYSKPL